MHIQYKICKYDSNIKCIKLTDCIECLQEEDEWTKKRIEYLFNAPIPVPDLETIVTERDSQ
jgi:hypothetical protein